MQGNWCFPHWSHDKIEAQKGKTSNLKILVVREIVSARDIVYIRTGMMYSANKHFMNTCNVVRIRLAPRNRFYKIMVGILKTLASRAENDRLRTVGQIKFY